MTKTLFVTSSYFPTGLISSAKCKSVFEKSIYTNFSAKAIYLIPPKSPQGYFKSEAIEDNESKYTLQYFFMLFDLKQLNLDNFSDQR